jgi:hypothetical protein
MAQRLLVGALLRYAIDDVFRERRAVAKLAALPFGIAIAIQAASLALPRPVPHADDGTTLVVTMITSAPYVLFAVPYYRYLLAGQLWPSVLFWSSAHTVLFAWAVLKAASHSAAGIFLGPSFGSVAVLGLIYLFARFCLVQPAAAIGELPDLGLAWARSRGNGWRLVWLRILVTLIAAVPTAIATGALVLLGIEPINAFRASCLLTLVIIEVLGTATLALAFLALRTPG